jgi:hypothetical protein
MRVLALIVLMLSMFVVPALAQSVEAPTLSLGDSWKRSNGVEYKVVRVEPESYLLEGLIVDCKTCLVKSAKDLAFIEATTADGKPLDPTQVRGVFIGAGWRFLDFPLQVGKEWRTGGTSFFRGSPQQLTADYKVHAIEDVKTKAGTFKAYRLVSNWTSTTSAGGAYRWTNQAWYSPEVKALVKATSTNPNIPEWELISYTLK